MIAVGKGPVISRFLAKVNTPSDGVAPRAKMNQQRSRRFRSAQEAKEKEAEAAEFVKLLVQGGKDIHESLQNKKVWDSNAITPGKSR